MAFVVMQTSCVDACPVEAFRVGPSGFYAVEEILKQMPSAKVDMFVRIVENSRFRFLDHIEIDKAIERAELVIIMMTSFMPRLAYAAVS